ncbi:hypothetical protein ACHAPU_001253 [Fusarium lateritium]
MDPVTAVGLASAIISFVPLGLQLLKNVKEIKSSIDGSVKQNETRQAVVEEMRVLATRLKHPQECSGRIPTEHVELLDLASRCYDLSQQILELLEEVKPKSQRTASKWVSGFRIYTKDGEIKDLEKGLTNCREQLLLGIVDLFRKDSTAYSVKILASIQKDSDKLGQLQSQLDQLRQAIAVIESHTSQKDVQHLGPLVNLHQDALSVAYQHRILQSLQFEGMNHREDLIHDPHGQTFEWLLEDEETSAGHNDEKHTAMVKRSRERFLDWLASSKGIFHVTGKLGSGKSTLMKFLYMHPRTQTELEKWAGEKRLILARFFFWNPGTDLQNSIRGLCRSLLRDVFTANPDLIQHAVPEIWEQAKRTPWMLEGKFDISAKTIQKAFERLLTEQDLQSRLFKHQRFCFFIDGLDEHVEAYGQDHKYLVTLIRNWVEKSCGNLKICASSRDYNVFLNAFSEKDRLHLPELTLFDMQEYVRSHLSHLQNAKDREHFTFMIPHRADGIFLWTVLVTTDIRRKIEDEVPHEKLVMTLDTIPSDLETFFQYLLNRIDKQEQKKAYQVMRMLLDVRNISPGIQDEANLTLLSFSLLDEYNQDHEFSTRSTFPTPELIAKWKNTELETYNKWLRGTCRGLVECKGTSIEDFEQLKIEFSHRSIPDMLKKPTLEKAMVDILGDFDVIDAYSHMTFGAEQLRQIERIDRSFDTCALIANIRLANKVDKSPYHFLEAMESWTRYSFPDPLPTGCLFLDLGAGDLSLGYADYITSDMLGGPNRNETFIYSPLYQAVRLGQFEYIKWKIENCPLALETQTKRSLLAAQVLDAADKDSLSRQHLDYFFEKGFLTDESDNPLSIMSYYFHVKHYTLEKQTTGQRYLMINFINWCGLGWLVGRYNDFNKKTFAHVVMGLLQHGNVGKFLVTIEGHDQDPLEGVFHFENILTIQFDTEKIEGTVQLEHVETWYKAGGKRTISLRQWIEAMDVENKSLLLDMIDGTIDSNKSSEPGTQESSLMSWSECRGASCTENTEKNSPATKHGDDFANALQFNTPRPYKNSSVLWLGISSGMLLSLPPKFHAHQRVHTVIIVTTAILLAWAGYFF